MYITYFLMGLDTTQSYGHVCTPHLYPCDPYGLWNWRITECEWMVPGTVTD